MLRSVCCLSSLKGLCEQTVKVLQLMEADGIESNLTMLNLLINAFSIAGRHLEAMLNYTISAVYILIG
ncbi:hypothetical protein Syun_017943 [Stephania yunnanensis]|uniref:Pentatricopeptide repeat-containing protein n=1 Tax=Stephania yunnanensis TaxID=152371 RepID=A0AAP0NXW5_9MAGN